MTLGRRPRVLLALALALLYVGLDVALPWRRLRAGYGDFRYYLQAGELLLAGRSPYELAAWDYPPFSTVLVAPLAALPRQASGPVWFLLSQAATLFAACWTWRAWRRHAAAGPVVALTWAVAHGLAVSLAEGQLNSILLALVCLALWPPRRWPTVATVAVAVATAIKLWPAILFPVELARRRLRALAAGVLLAIGLVAVPAGFLRWATDGPVRPQIGAYLLGTPAFLNHSLPAFALRLREPPRAGEALPRNWVAGNQTEKLRLDAASRAVAVAVSLGALLVGLALLLAAARGSVVEPWRWGAALIALALVAAPISWPHYQALQLPGTAALTLDLLARRRRAQLATLWIAFLVAQWTEAIVVGPYLAAHGTRADSIAAVWGLSTAPVLAGVLLFALHLRAMREAARSGSESRPGDVGVAALGEP